MTFFLYDHQVLNDRESLFVEKPVNSGLLIENNIVYTCAYPESDYPVIRIPYDIKDGFDNVLPNGFYMLALDVSKKYLLLIQSARLKARIPVLKFSEKMPDEKNEKERTKLQDKYEHYMLHGRQRKAKKYKNDLDILDKRIKAKMSADIELTNDGFYIIRYETAFQKASAILPAL